MIREQDAATSDLGVANLFLFEGDGLMTLSAKSSNVHQAMTLIEVLVAISIIGVLVAILLPAVQNAREAMRRAVCSNRLRQVALAVHGYQSAFNQLPMQGGGTAERGGVRTLPDHASNHHRLGYAVAILPYLEQQTLYDLLSSRMGLVGNGTTFPPMGPVPWYNFLPYSSPDAYPPWGAELASLRCPSDPARASESGAINYAACMGDGIRELGCAYGSPQWRYAGDLHPVRYDDSTKRGLFANWYAFRFRDCTDGLSNTLLMGEIAASGGRREVRGNTIMGLAGIVDDPEICLKSVDPNRPRFYPGTAVLEPRGQRWADAAPTFSGFSTVLPPNSPSCAEIPDAGVHANWFGGIFSAGSYHPGGVNVAMADGSVRFITESIDSKSSGRSQRSVYRGNSENRPGSKSPYGVWGAMGTRAGAEVVPQGS